VVAVSIAVVTLGTGPVAGHGALTMPGSRTYLCRIDGTHGSGDIVPGNPACADAVAEGGKQPLWDWFGVLRSDGAGRTRGFIPDGELCSAGTDTYRAYDQPGADWPHTRLTAGAEVLLRYNAWAHHPGEFRLYVTRDGYDPEKPLTWDDLESEPFSVFQEESPNGTDEVNDTPEYRWSAVLPDKSGRHLIYSVWERSDSAETFYGCSDVEFDGGNGEVVGLGADGASLAATVGTDGTAADTSEAAEMGTGAGAGPGDATRSGGQAGVEGAGSGTICSDSAGGQEGLMDEVASSGPATGAGGIGSGWVMIAGLFGAALGVVSTIAVGASIELRRVRAPTGDSPPPPPGGPGPGSQGQAGGVEGG
jgi:chitin-binding protein